MDYNILGSVLAAIVTISGFLYSMFKISRDMRAERITENAQTLSEAKAYTDGQVALLQGKIKGVENSIKNLERAVDQDIQHVRQTYNSEIHNLTIKVEELREQITKGHSEMIGLISKMIEKDRN